MQQDCESNVQEYIADASGNGNVSRLLWLLFHTKKPAAEMRRRYLGAGWIPACLLEISSSLFYFAHSYLSKLRNLYFGICFTLISTNIVGSIALLYVILTVNNLLKPQCKLNVSLSSYASNDCLYGKRRHISQHTGSSALFC